MRSPRGKGVLLLLAGTLALAWAIGPGSSGVQQGSMHNWPQAGTCDEAFDTGIASDGATAGCDGTTPGMANPAAVYCEELGYEYSVVDTDEGQYGICILPGGSRCNEWDFLEGKCGGSYSYCARQGYDLATKTDGKNPFSREYSFCLYDQEEIGAATELMGLSQKAVRGSSAVQQSASPSGEGGSVGSPPSSFDWRNYGGQDWMTSVKNQGLCGSCWAFSAVGVVEAIYNIASNNPNLDLNLSEEYLVADCLLDQSCCGGWMDTALAFVRDEGIPDEGCLPYVDLYSCTCGDTCDPNCAYAGSGICSDATCSDRCPDWQDRLRTIDAVGDVSPSQIKQSVVDTGPLTVTMGIGSDYGGYFDGDIYRCTDDSGINHGVIIAGYDDAGGYWIVKNSWGSSWGDDGYFKVGYGECAIEESAVYGDVATVGDSDGDGFTTTVEEYVGTDPLDACPDDPSDDCWPPDVNMDTVVDVTDALIFLAAFPSADGQPNYSQRLDMVNGDGVIDVSDALAFLAFFPGNCTNP